jgi:Zn-dependent protease
MSNITALILRLVIQTPIVLISLTVHEFAHGWVSSKLGDPTPRRSGRLTLNPFAHLDVIGTLLMIVTGFGWARPVPVNPQYYKNYKKGMMLTAAAGPLANLLLAVIGMIIYYMVLIISVKLGPDLQIFYTIEMFAYMFVYVNLCFMIFNIIPIPPLDGSKILGIFLPNGAYYKMLQYDRYFMLLIMLLSLTGAFGTIIGTGVNFVISLLDKPFALLLKVIM